MNISSSYQKFSITILIAFPRIPINLQLLLITLQTLLIIFPLFPLHVSHNFTPQNTSSSINHENGKLNVFIQVFSWILHT